jgi:urease accessory protein
VTALSAGHLPLVAGMVAIPPLPAYTASMSPRLFLKILTLFTALLVSSSAVAHPGHYHPPEEVDEFDQEAFFSAAAHPFTGLDHLLAMVAAGALAAGGRRGVGAVFVAGVAAGFVTGLAGPEWLVALTLVAVGGLLWRGPPIAGAWVWIAVGVTGVLHGGAHAGDMGGVAAGLGLVAGTLGGVAMVMIVMRRLVALPQMAVRYAGASVALLGLLLTVTRIAGG